MYLNLTIKTTRRQNKYIQKYIYLYLLSQYSAESNTSVQDQQQINVVDEVDSVGECEGRVNSVCSIDDKESCDLNWAMTKPRNSTTLVMIVDKINWLLNR